jgi:hypothetical protein
MDVTKFDGSRQPFDRNKVVYTCLRMGASQKVAEKIASYIEGQLYDGIETRKIYRKIHGQLRKHVPSTRFHIDLRKAICLMKSKPDFECFVRVLLREHGYEVTANQVIMGRCVEHEIDGVVRKDGKTYILEVKHHSNPHTPTGLDVGRVARAVFEDVIEGYEANLSALNVDGVIIVCNTKLSEHAKIYADCRNIIHIGWKSRSNNSLQAMIEAKKLYPVTLLKALDSRARRKLESAEIFLLRELLDKRSRELSQLIDIPINKIKQMRQIARRLLQRE